MKKRMLATVALLLFFIIATTSNAEMRIAPGGITTPDDSAALHLKGIFATRGFSPASYGAVIIARTGNIDTTIDM